MDNPLEALAWRLAFGAITPEQFDQLSARLHSADPNPTQTGGVEADFKLTLNDLYSAYREYLNHEHHLINQRLGWNFTIQAFLFAAYGLALGKIADIRIAAFQKPAAFLGPSFHDFQLGALSIAILGFSVSVAVLLSVLGALLSVNSLLTRWGKFDLDKRGTLKILAELAGLPEIMGGGHRWAVPIGFYAPVALPVILASVWALILYDRFKVY